MKLKINGFFAENLVKKFGSPLYVYDQDKIIEKIDLLKDNFNQDLFNIYYACKANNNQAILKMILDFGLFIETVSVNEVKLALLVGFEPKKIFFTGYNVSQEEFEFLIKNNILVNIDSLSQLELYGRLNPNSEVSIRINPDIGKGVHQHVITGGAKDKFGIAYAEVEKIKEIIQKHSLKIISLHLHIGSGISDYNDYLLGVDFLIEFADNNFNDVKRLNFGGGFSIPYCKDDKVIDLKKLSEGIIKRLRGKYLGAIEPGRFIIAEAGYLLTTVTNIKQNNYHKLVGVDTGFNHLIRPMMYDAYHEIINASSLTEDKEKVRVVGNLCESGDILNKEIEISKVKEGDILIILDAGAYGFSMSSNYNLFGRPAEILVNSKNQKIIRKREIFEDIISSDLKIT